MSYYYVWNFLIDFGEFLRKTLMKLEETSEHIPYLTELLVSSIAVWFTYMLSCSQ